MPLHQNHTLDEILSQPASWASALEAVHTRAGAIQSLARPFTIMSGCGSPHYLALSAAFQMRSYGRACLAAPASEILFHPDSLIPQGAAPLAILFSRSGETSETIAAAAALRRRGAATIAVGCDASTTLLRQADLAVEVAAGREQSVVQTRSFAGMLVAAQAIVALAAQRSGDSLAAGLARLPDLGPAYLERAYAAAQDPASLGLAADRSIERIFVLGSGLRYGLACEAALKFKEMSLTPSESFHTLEFRHGPMSLADERALVIGLIGDAGPNEELAVLREVQAFGARTVAITEGRADRQGLDAIFPIESGLIEEARAVLYLAPLQLMAYTRTIACGLNPDAPRNLVTFVQLDTLGAQG